MDVIYSKHCGCCRPADFDEVSGLRWRELQSCWEQAIRLGLVSPPGLVEEGVLVEQGPAAVKLLRQMARP